MATKEKAQERKHYLKLKTEPLVKNALSHIAKKHIAIMAKAHTKQPIDLKIYIVNY